MKGHDGLGLLNGKTGSVGNSLFRRPAARHLDSAAHPYLSTHIIGQPDDITAKRVKRCPAVIHRLDNMLTGINNLAPALGLKLKKLVTTKNSC